VLITDGKEPGDADYTQAAEIAAFYSKAEGQNVAVDYTTVRQLKRPPGSRPGFVIYHQNWTAYVTPDADRIAKLRVNGGK
jgi:predicted ribosome quality control (RQC) complex YloA/Tae2 family protein